VLIITIITVIYDAWLDRINEAFTPFLMDALLVTTKLLPNKKPHAAVARRGVHTNTNRNSIEEASMQSEVAD
jgi:hypothetical protein